MYAGKFLLNPCPTCNKVREGGICNGSCKRHKVAELEGARLDAAVAMAEGFPFRYFPNAGPGGLCNVQREVDGEQVWGAWAPSEEWAHGGPIVQRERILLWPDYCHPHGATDQWRAQCFGPWERKDGPELAPLEEGPTPLIAAMRAYVTSKFGEQVELP